MRRRRQGSPAGPASRRVASAFGIAAALAVIAAAPASARADTIKEIEVQENTKTTDDTVVLISGLEKGDDFALSEIEGVRERLVTCGLFKFVDVFAVPMPGGLRIVIVARDKHPWALGPTYFNQPTNKGGGFGFGHSNLFGRNKKLGIYGQIASGDSFFVGGYVDPSIKGTRFRWATDLYLASIRTIEYSTPDSYLGDTTPVRESRMSYLNAAVRFGVELFRGATFDVRVRGAHVSFSDVGLAGVAEMSDVTDDPDATLVPAPGKGGLDTSVELSAAYDNRANWYGISDGNKVALSYERSSATLGSDFDYWYASVQVERARRYFERHNFVVRAGFTWGEDLPFQQELTAGGLRLRGYKSAQFRGDLKALMNLEYSVPLFTIKGVALRAMAFGDAAYTTLRDASDVDSGRNYLPDSDSHGLGPLKTSIGVGTRLYIRQIVLPLLGLDVGYGPERRAFEIYLAIGVTDF